MHDDNRIFNNCYINFGKRKFLLNAIKALVKFRNIKNYVPVSILPFKYFLQGMMSS